METHGKRGKELLLAFYVTALAAGVLWTRMTPARRAGQLLLADHEPHLHARLAAELYGNSSCCLPQLLFPKNRRDLLAWQPQGLQKAQLAQPGLLFLAGSANCVGNLFGTNLDMDDACVLIPPILAAAAVLAMFGLGREIKGEITGICASFFLALVPAFLSRSTAGEFTQEGVVLPFLIAACWCYLRAVRTGSFMTMILAVIVYSYVSSLIGLKTAVCLAGFNGKKSTPAVKEPQQCCLWVLSACSDMRVHFVHLVCVFVMLSRLFDAGAVGAALPSLIWIVAGVTINHCLEPTESRPFRLAPLLLPLCAIATLSTRMLYSNSRLRRLCRRFVHEIKAAAARNASAFMTMAALVALAAVVYARIKSQQLSASLDFEARLAAFASIASPDAWRRALLLGDAGRGPYAGASENVWENGTDAGAVVAAHGDGLAEGERLRLLLQQSISANKPPSWASFYFELHALILLSSHGLFVLFDEVPLAAAFFLTCWTIGAGVLSGLVLRYMLLLAPAACLLAGISVSRLVRHALSLQHETRPRTKQQKPDARGAARSVPRHATYANALRLLPLAMLLVSFAAHSLWLLDVAYGMPPLVQLARRSDGTSQLLDDRREAYAWLRNATEKRAVVAAWWDHGYEIAHLAQRPTLVDGSVFAGDPRTIAAVGRAMLSNEEVGVHLLQSLGADYVLVRFGGVTGEAEDDISKAYWMGRIAYNRGELMQLTPDSLLYKMSYHRFGQTMLDGYLGYDRARDAKIHPEPVTLSSLEEVFTSKHWSVRVYRLVPPVSQDQAAFSGVSGDT